MRRVLVTGMGGELGTRVTQLLEEEPAVGEIAGCDLVPPRRRLRRAEFRRIDPRRRERLVEFVTEFAPTALVHAGVYEPAARLDPVAAAERSELCAAAALGAAERTGELERIVLRSGIEVYGPRRSAASVPDESVLPAPRSAFGRTLLHVEAVAAGVGRRRDLPVTAVRLAPVVGSHVPSPLGRLLRLPAVPVPATADPPFSIVHTTDAARAIVAALLAGYDGPLNVVGPGAASPWQAVRLGGRLPLPVLPPFWGWAARAAELAGAAIAGHVVELLRHGRTAAGGRAVDVLGLGTLRGTQEVLTDLYEWGSVVPFAAREEAA